jgi:hypothetical protein
MASPGIERKRRATELMRAIRRAELGYDECERRLAAFDRRADARVRRLVAAGQVRPTLVWLSSDEHASAAERSPHVPERPRRTAARTAASRRAALA